MRRSTYLRFSIRSLLRVTGLIAVATWWIQWPSITASTFAHDPQTFFADGRWKDAPPSIDSSAFAEFIAREGTPALIAHSRTVRECLLSKQTFDCGMFEFTVVRGAITSGPSRRAPWPFRSYMSNEDLLSD